MPPKKGGGPIAAALAHGNQYSSRSNTGVPQKLDCCRCGKSKGASNFSNKQLSDYRRLAGTKGPNFKPRIVCRLCTGAQVTEFRCHQCDKVKGIEAFSKAQRHNPDKAVCMVCMEHHLDIDAVNELAYDDDDSSDPELDLADGWGQWYYDHSYDKQYESALTESNAGVDTASVTTAASLRTASVTGGVNLHSQGGSSRQSAKNWAALAAPGSSTVSTSSKMGGPSYASSVQSAAAYSTTREEPEKPSSRSRFAKVPAYKPPKEKEDRYATEGDDETNDDWKSDHANDTESDDSDDDY